MEILKRNIPQEFMPYHTPGQQVMLFSKVVMNSNGKKVYAPIGGHYAFYLSEFEELV